MCCYECSEAPCFVLVQRSVLCGAVDEQSGGNAFSGRCHDFVIGVKKDRVPHSLSFDELQAERLSV